MLWHRLPSKKTAPCWNKRKGLRKDTAAAPSKAITARHPPTAFSTLNTAEHGLTMPGTAVIQHWESFDNKQMGKDSLDFQATPASRPKPLLTIVREMFSSKTLVGTPPATHDQVCPACKKRWKHTEPACGNVPKAVKLCVTCFETGGPWENSPNPETHEHVCTSCGSVWVHESDQCHRPIEWQCSGCFGAADQ